MAESDVDPTCIAVVGGGVSGITTALLLELHGLPTVLYARAQPFGAHSDPEFATVHAAASVLPHSVRSTRLTDWTRTSTQVFRGLAFSAAAGVRSQLHYEMFESRVGHDEPEYAGALDDFTPLSGAETAGRQVPRRPGADDLWGWRFRAFFCEAPKYLEFLYELYAKSGGTVISTRGMRIDESLPAYLDRGHTVLVNCTGIGSIRLLDPNHLGALLDLPLDGRFEPLLDPFAPRVLRGHYLRARVGLPLVDARGNFLSYNYTPHPAVYEGRDGMAADVYCYPRSDAWILGGTRQPGTFDGRDVSWEGREDRHGQLALPGADGSTMVVPSTILSLNSAVVSHLSAGEIRLDNLGTDRLAPGIGYRFERTDPEGSVRLACSRVGYRDREVAIVHNYGHGGAGFTLSWGCASDILRWVEDLEAGGWLPTIQRRPTSTPTGSVEAAILKATSI